VLLVVTGTLLCSCYGGSRDTVKDSDSNLGSDPSIMGTPAAVLELPDLEGRAVRLQDFKGKVVLLNFWGTTCAPCKTEIPWLVEFQEQYGSKGLQVVAASMYGEGPEILKPFVAQYGMEQFRTVIGNERTMRGFGLVAFPNHDHCGSKWTLPLQARRANSSQSRRKRTGSSP
jgi:thiol-disulfide isomerase/thioredoxin